MSPKFSSWLRSKSGMVTIAGVIVLALVVAVIGQQLGWLSGFGAAGAPPDPVTCGVLPTNYTVQNPATSPFYGINYVWTSGQKVKSGSADYYTFVLPADIAQSLISVRVQINASPYVGDITLDACNFAGPEACNTQMPDLSGRFKAQFVGATDNGDGTLTLKFYVQVITTRYLRNVAFALPANVVPSAPTGTYTGATCP